MENFDESGQDKVILFSSNNLSSIDEDSLSLCLITVAWTQGKLEILAETLKQANVNVLEDYLSITAHIGLVGKKISEQNFDTY